MNETEKQFFDEVIKAGYIPLRAGYPDFLVTHEHSNGICFVEIKSGTNTLSPQQEMMIQTLRKVDIPAVVSHGHFTLDVRKEITRMALYKDRIKLEERKLPSFILERIQRVNDLATVARDCVHGYYKTKSEKRRNNFMNQAFANVLMIDAYLSNIYSVL